MRIDARNIHASKRSKDLFVVPQPKSALIVFALVALVCALPCFGQTAPPAPASSPGTIFPGSINGTIVDQTGAFVAGARVSLTRIRDDKEKDKAQIPTPDVVSGDNGQFSFTSVTPGPFQLTV